MRHLGLVACAMASALAVGTGASAQSGTGPGMAQEATPGAGPNIPQAPETQVDLISDVLYNSNVAASGEELAAQRGLKLADVVTTPSVDLTLARSLGRELLFIQGNAGYDIYAVNHVLDRERLDVLGGVNAHLGPCQEVATGEWLRHQNDLVESVTNVVRNTIDVETVSGTVTCGQVIGLAPSLAVSYTWRDNSAAQLVPSDSRFLTVAPTLGYQQPAFGSFALIGQFSQAVFPNERLAVFDPSAPDGFLLVTDGFNIYSGGVKFDRHLGGRLEGAVSVSYTDLVPSIAGTGGFRGVTYSLDATYKLADVLTAHTNLTRATLPSNQINATFVVEEIYEADVSRALGSHLKISLTASAEDQDYGGARLGPSLPLTQATIYKVFASATYAFTQRLSLTLDTGDEQRHANAAGLSYSSLQVGLTAKLSFGH